MVAMVTLELAHMSFSSMDISVLMHIHESHVSKIGGIASCILLAAASQQPHSRRMWEPLWVQKVLKYLPISVNY